MMDARKIPCPDLLNRTSFVRVMVTVGGNLSTYMGTEGKETHMQGDNTLAAASTDIAVE